MTFKEFLIDRDIIEHGSIRVSDCKAAYEAGRRAAAYDKGAEYYYAKGIGTGLAMAVEIAEASSPDLILKALQARLRSIECQLAKQ